MTIFGNPHGWREGAEDRGCARSALQFTAPILAPVLISVTVLLRLLERRR